MEKALNVGKTECKIVLLIDDHVSSNNCDVEEDSIIS